MHNRALDLPLQIFQSVMIQTDSQLSRAHLPDETAQPVWNLSQRDSSFQLEALHTGVFSAVIHCVPGEVGRFGEQAVPEVEVRVQRAYGAFHEERRAHQYQKIVRDTNVPTLSHACNPQQRFRKRPFFER